MRLQAHIYQRQCCSVAIVNAAAKYSLEPLEGDGWEVRRAKQMVRALARERAKGGMTTEELARRCSRFLGEEGAVKTATLNGIFAGKRKSFSVAELEMFAAALSLPIDRILFPTGEQIEVRPGRFKSSADALVSSMSVTFPAASYPVRVGGRAEGALAIVQDAEEIADAAARVIGGYRLGLGTENYLALRMMRLGFAPQNLSRSIQRYRETWHEEPPTIPPGVSAVLEVDLRTALSADKPDYEAAIAMLLPLEPLFEGIWIGDYRLGGPESSPQTVAYSDGEGNPVNVPASLVERRVDL